MFRFQLFSQLPRDPVELKRHITMLKRMTNAKEHQEVFDHLYGCLSILDSKSSSMLGVNSIMLAVFAIFMTQEHAVVEWVLLNSGMGAILVSSFLLLSVVWVHWSTTDNLLDLEQHALVLLQVRRRRTVKYRLAWYFSVLSVSSLSAFLLYRGVSHLIEQAPPS